MEFIWKISKEFWFVLAEMSPYLLLGFFVAGVLSIFISPKTVETHLGGRGFWPILKASLFGVPLPLCSCGVIPVTTSLRKHGASKGASVGFLLSTPQTGIDSIAVTYSLLGPVFAIFRPLVALITGLIGGTAVELLGHTKESLQVEQQIKCDEECCDDSENKNHKIIRVMRHGFIVLPRDISRALVVGLFIAALLSALVPENFFADKLGTGITAKIVMMLLGIPVYVCSSASVPVAAAMIFHGGLTPGAALVFLMTGPATNAATIATIWKVFSRRIAIIYLLTVAGCALAAGILLDAVTFEMEMEKIVAKPAWMLPDILKYTSAVILLALLIFAALTARKEN